MIKADPAQSRRSLELVKLMVETGILFVPVPVESFEEHRAKLYEVAGKLEHLIKQIEDAEAEEKKEETKDA